MQIPEFESIKVNTITAIASVNIDMDINLLFENLPIIDYIVHPKKRGRKKNTEGKNSDLINYTNGSIISIEPSGGSKEVRGIRLKKKKDKKTNIDRFRNALTVIMIMDGKFINFKISKNGFQFTGCKSYEQVINCVKVIWEYIKDSNMWKWKYDNTSELECILVPAMRNINFFIGYNIDRVKLNNFINNHTSYRSLFDSTTGYTGVNIKIPHKNDITDLKIDKYVYSKGKWLDPVKIPFSDYLSLSNEKEREKKINKVREHTFLVFHSGKIIMSSMCDSLAKDVYYDFMKIMKGENVKQFKEILLECDEEN